MRTFIIVMIAGCLSACSVTSHPSQIVDAGQPSQRELIVPSLAERGPIRFHKVVAADWAVDRGGLINLDDPKAKAAGLTDEEEPIQIYFYVIDHPQFGRYLVDSGIETRMKETPEKSPVGGLISKFLKMQKLVIHQTTREWTKQNPDPIKGLFLTHMHADHIMGVPDLQTDLPIYVGPAEATHKSFKNMLARGLTDDFLEGPRTISELRFTTDVIDFFGDKSLFILSVPGHTPGSLAFVVNAESGPQLIVGDTCHTRWGWEQNVTPGSFSSDRDLNKKSLDFLEELAKSVPGIQVHLGHQSAI